MPYYIEDQEYPYDPIQLFNELQACGIDANCDASGNIDGSPALGELVKKAHEKPLDSPEAIKLRDAIGGGNDPRWLAYVAARKTVVLAARAKHYQKRIMALVVELFRSAKYIDHPDGKLAVFKPSLLAEIGDEIRQVVAEFPDVE